MGAAVAAGGKRKHVGKTRRRERKGATGLGAGRRVTRVTRSAVERAAHSEAGRERVGRVAERVKERRARGREGEQDGAVGGRKRSSRGRAAEDAPT